jgi:hypothetical protein
MKHPKDTLQLLALQLVLACALLFVLHYFKGLDSTPEAASGAVGSTFRIRNL